MIELGIVKAIQQMNAAGPRRSQTDTQLASELRICAGHECGGFLVPHLNKTNFSLIDPQRLHDSVDTIARQSENKLHSPIDKPFYQYLACIHDDGSNSYGIIALGCRQ